jgi:hypothetical protein
MANRLHTLAEAADDLLRIYPHLLLGLASYV